MPISNGKVYCAGPLFNQSERREMTEIADVLVEAGYRVYLPHRDGMEFRLVLSELTDRGWDLPTAGQFLHAAIFALDVYQLAVECDSMVWNLNGRTPDEGAVSEAAMAWTLGKPLVAYRDDVRSLIAGRVNPLLVGMVGFESVDDISQIPQRLAETIRRHADVRPMSHFSPAMDQAVQRGRILWETMQKEEAVGDNRLIADVVQELFAPGMETSATENVTTQKRDVQ
ncbi:MAG: nucleoside 2-deoxyribosyltransferase [Planctomycetaceae bacterium]